MENLEKNNTSPRRVLFCWLGIVLVMGLFYAVFAQRGPSWQDSGEFQWRILASDYPGGLGLARSHPLYIAAGRGVLALSGKSNFCWAISAFSGLGMAVALANLVWLGWLLMKKILPGFLCAAMLAVAHTPWWLSEVAEVYTWQLAFFMAELAVLTLLWRGPRVWLLCVLALLAGLDLGVHNFAFLAYPVYFVVVMVLVFRRKLPVWSLLAGLGCWCIGAGCWIGMIVWLFERTGDLWYSIRDAMVGIYGDKIFVADVNHELVAVNLVLISMNFVNLLLPLAVVGLWRLRKVIGRPLTIIFYAIIAIHLIFFIRYPVPDKFTFILPSLGLIAVMAIVGLNYLINLGPRWKKAIVTLCVLGVIVSPIAYATSVKAIKRVKPSLAKQRWEFRDELAYWLVPWKCGETSALRYSRHKLDAMLPGQKVDMSGKGTALYPMLVTQIVENRREDVFLTSDKQPGGEFREKIYSNPPVDSK